MFKKSLEDIVKSFSKIQNDLDLYLDNTSAKIGFNEESILVLQGENKELIASVNRASKIKQNINKLIGE